MPVILEWEWEDEDLIHLAEHGADMDTVLDVWEEGPKYRKNTKGRTGYRMIGPDLGGTLWTFLIRPVEGRPGIWRPVTGYTLDAGDDDLTWYETQKRKGEKK